MLVRAERISKSLNGRTVLAGVSFVVNRGDKIGIVGANDVGKTTLLRLIGRELEPDEGEIVVAGRPEVGWFRPELPTTVEATLYSAVLGELEQIQRRIDSVRRELAEDPADEAAQAKLEAFEEELNLRFGPDYRRRAEKVLAGLGFGPERYQDAVSAMAAGERARLALARVLVGRAELLLLDEPTSCLDIDQRQWLERYLEDYQGTVLTVARDRAFLNEVANRIFELRDGRLTVYDGGYFDYLFQQEQELRRQEREQAEHDREIARLDRMARRQDALASGWRKTGTGGKKARAAAVGRPARNGGRTAARAETVSTGHQGEFRVSDNQPVSAIFRTVEPGRRAVLVKGLSKSFGRRCIVRDAGFEIRTGERVALVGPNGCGKTVLLRVLVGELRPDRGTVTTDTAIRTGYFPQDLGTLDLQRTALEEVMKSGVGPDIARVVLDRLLFARDLAERRLSELSVGERAKVLLARVLTGGADLLVLDEPAAHLDLEAMAALEKLLLGCSGAIVFATHDRAMLDRLAGRVFELRDGRLVDFPGSWQAFLAQRSESLRPAGQEKDDSGRRPRS